MNKDPGLKILHLASGDLWAGSEVQLFTLVKTLHSTTDVMLTVVLLNHGILEQKLLELGIDVSILDEAQLNSFQILHRLIRKIRDARPDVIHTHRAKENILGSLAVLLAGSIPSLRTSHGNPRHGAYLEKFPQRLVSFLDSMCGRYLQQRIVAVSEDLAEILKIHLPAKKICVIENGIDFDSIRLHKVNNGPDPVNGDGTFRIGLAGRLVAVKRVDLFIQTARYMMDHHPDLKASFHIFGDGPMLDELEKLNHELNTGDIVHFEGHCKDILPRLQDLDVLVMTSDHEGLPMILLEAMALQVPVVAHAVGGIPGLLGQGSCGILVHDHCASAYADALYRLAMNPDTLSEISQCALERVRKKYSAGQNAQAYLREYSAIRKQSE